MNKEEKILAWFLPNDYTVRTGHLNTGPSKTRPATLTDPLATATLKASEEEQRFNSACEPAIGGLQLSKSTNELICNLLFESLRATNRKCEVRETKSPKVPARCFETEKLYFKGNDTRRGSSADQESDTEK